MADKPEEFRNCKAKELLQNLHAAWDDIHFIDGYPGDFVCLARRKGNDWYVAAINAGEAKNVDIPLTFLKSGNYQTTLYTDGNHDSLAIRELRVSSNESLNLKLAENGGFVFVVKNSFND